MSFFKKWFNKGSKEDPQEGSFPWIEATQNEWGVKVLDLQSVTQHMLATSTDPQMAANAVSYNSEDGTSFMGIEPVQGDIISSNIMIPIDKVLAPGVLFIPQTMEHKWAIYYHDNMLIFVRSWLRQVFVTAKTVQKGNELIIESIKGKFTNDESPQFTRNLLKYLLISHGISQDVPAPLPLELATVPKNAAWWAFSAYGNMTRFGVFDETFDPVMVRPLRSHSLLHIAVAKGNVDEIERQFKNGLSLDLLAGDGLAPLHWSMGAKEIKSMEKLLALGANPNIVSYEGATPLMNAVQSNKMLHLNLLLEAGANVNAIDSRGFTSLHRAAEMGHVDVVKILLSKGADKTVSVDGHTALSFAKMRGNEAIAQLLQD